MDEPRPEAGGRRVPTILLTGPSSGWTPPGRNSRAGTSTGSAAPGPAPSTACRRRPSPAWNTRAWVIRPCSTTTTPRRNETCSRCASSPVRSASRPACRSSTRTSTALRRDRSGRISPTTAWTEALVGRRPNGSKAGRSRPASVSRATPAGSPPRRRSSTPPPHSKRAGGPCSTASVRRSRCAGPGRPYPARVRPRPRPPRGPSRPTPPISTPSATAGGCSGWPPGTCPNPRARFSPHCSPRAPPPCPVTACTSSSPSTTRWPATTTSSRQILAAPARARRRPGARPHRGRVAPPRGLRHHPRGRPLGAGRHRPLRRGPTPAGVRRPRRRGRGRGGRPRGQPRPEVAQGRLRVPPRQAGGRQGVARRRRLTHPPQPGPRPTAAGRATTPPLRATARSRDPDFGTRRHNGPSPRIAAGSQSRARGPPPAHPTPSPFHGDQVHESGRHDDRPPCTPPSPGRVPHPRRDRPRTFRLEETHRGPDRPHRGGIPRPPAA